MKREMTCIACPIGCALTAEWESGSAEVTISGNQCRRGEEYGREEILAPSRMVTATVSIGSARTNRVPVKSSRPVPKELIPQLLDELYRVVLEAPVEQGDLVLGNYAGSGVDIITTRSVKESFE